MALIYVGKAIPENGVVTYWCEQRQRHNIRHAVNKAYASGGIREVREYLARNTSKTGITQDREK